MSARSFFEQLTAGAPAAQWARIRSLVNDKEPESLHLDFKVAKNEPPGVLDTWTKSNLGRAISAFANTEGGVLLYGIATQKGAKREPDTAERFTPVPDVALFHVAVEAKTRVVVDPVVSGVRLHHILDPAGTGAGALVVFIPASDGGPHRTVKTEDPSADERYFMRTATSTEVTPHALLADKFGRRPPPRLRLVLARDGRSLVVYVANFGRGLARDVLVRASFIPLVGNATQQTKFTVPWERAYPRALEHIGERYAAYRLPPPHVLHAHDTQRIVDLDFLSPRLAVRARIDCDGAAPVLVNLPEVDIGDMRHDGSCLVGPKLLPTVGGDDEPDELLAGLRPLPPADGT